MKANQMKSQIVQHQHIGVAKAGIAQTQTTMTSREIAELTSKEHFHVKRDIEKMLLELDEDVSKFGCIYFDSMNREQTEYALDRELTETLLTGYSAILRRKVIARWRELEAGAASASSVAQIPTAIQPAKEFRALFGIARLIGMDKNAAAISANHGVKALTGTNMLALMEATHLKSETQSLHFTPTELGKRLCISALAFNRKLADAGLQERISGHWSPTSRGKPYAVVLDTGKAHESGTPVQQVKWIEAVLDEVTA